MVLKLFGLVVFVVFFYWKLSTSTHCAIKSYGFLELCYWVQVMACRLIGARPLPEPILTYCSIGIWKNLENGIDIEICVRQVRLSCCLQMATVLFRPRWVDVIIYHIYIYKKSLKLWPHVLRLTAITVIAPWKHLYQWLCAGPWCPRCWRAEPSICL